jgi:transcriptional regulator GlxA family with amidase domain
MTRIGMLAFEGMMASSLFGPMDAFRIANSLARRVNPSATPFEIRVLNANNAADVHCAGGFRIATQVAAIEELDLLLVPGLEYQSADHLLSQIDKLSSEQNLLKRAYQAGLTIGASCSGTFLLARSGVLDHHAATTSWWLAPLFQREFPAIRLQADQVLVESDRLITSGATTSMFTLVVRYIERMLSADLANAVAKFLLIDPQRQNQAAFVCEAMLSRPRSTFSEKIDAFLRAHLGDVSLSVEHMAQHCAMSSRSLIRHFQSTYHCSPHAHLQSLRIDAAKALLENSAMPLERVVQTVGYTDVASFRKLFKRLTGATPGHYRTRFQARS